MPSRPSTERAGWTWKPRRSRRRSTLRRDPAHPPAPRPRPPPIAEIREAAPHLDLAIRNLRVLARAVARHTRARARPADDLLKAVRELQAAVGALLRDGQALERHAVAALAFGARVRASATTNSPSMRLSPSSDHWPSIYSARAASTRTRRSNGLHPPHRPVRQPRSRTSTADHSGSVPAVPFPQHHGTEDGGELQRAGQLDRALSDLAASSSSARSTRYATVFWCT